MFSGLDSPVRGSWRQMASQVEVFVTRLVMDNIHGRLVIGGGPALGGVSIIIGTNISVECTF